MSDAHPFGPPDVSGRVAWLFYADSATQVKAFLPARHAPRA